MIRAEQFDANVKEPLLQMKNEVENLNIDDLDDSQRLELARAKRVLAYVLNYINLLDPDLLPQTFYSQIRAKAQSWNKNIPHLNQVLDEILFYLASYGNIYIPKNQVSNIITEMINSYDSAIRQSLQEINLNKVKKDAKAIESYENELLSADGSIKRQIENSQIQIQNWFNKIKKFNDDFFVKQEGKEVSIKAEIENAKEEITTISQSVQDLFDEFIETKKNIDNFSEKIFGKENNNGEKVGGLQQEIIDRQNQLDKYEEKQKIKIQAWKNEIENLLKDATNASLASSYEKSKINYRWAIIGWNISFIFSMLSIVGIAFWGFLEVADKLNEPLAISGALLVRLPFYIPLAWLAIFSTQRRNESKRLQEEYKHKETLARSFLGYKKQIDEMQDGPAQDNINLAKKLMENLVEITSQNPNKALYKAGNMPMFEFLNKIAKMPSEAREFLKDIIAIVKSS